MLHDGTPKIVNFGLTATKEALNSDPGRLAYVSPELIISKQPTSAVDSWSFGVMLYNLLFNSFPFGDPLNNKDYLQNVWKNPYIISDKQQTSVSQCTLDLLDKCFDRSPESRINFSDVRRHPCFHFLPGFFQKYKAVILRFSDGEVYEGQWNGQKNGKFSSLLR